MILFIQIIKMFGFLNVKGNIEKKYFIEKVKIILLSSIIALIVMGIFYYVFAIYEFVKFMNKETQKLQNVNNLGVNIQNGELKNKKIIDLVKDYMDLLRQKQILRKRFQEYQSAYTNLLINFYLPSLDVWKDPYNGHIDTTLIGKKFIKQNPYIDTNLIERWTTFFTNLGARFRKNEIKSLRIGDIKEDRKKGIFRIPITVEVFCPNRWNFLALVGKISLTANKRNISLINEFFYYLFQGIKKKYPTLTDKQIGEEIYRWIKDGRPEKYIDNDVLDYVIKKIAICDELNKDCYLRFKQKYSSIPIIAYNIGDSSLSFKEKKNLIKRFLGTYLPPLIDLKSFTFRKQEIIDNNQLGIENGFVVKINFDILGRGISFNEIKEIKQALGNACLGSGKYLDENVAKGIIHKKLIDISKVGNIDSQEIFNYKEMLSYIDNIIKEKKNLSNYKYIIKLFEIYRILNENGLCNK